MKPIRLLATLAMIIAGLAVPAPASAIEFKPGPTPNQEALKGVCDLFSGKYIQEERSYICELGDTPILCAVDREVQRCGYEVTARLWPPPLRDDCLEARGSFLSDTIGVALCDLREGVLSLDCLIDPKEPNMPSVCNVGWIPSEQPMT